MVFAGRFRYGMTMTAKIKVSNLDVKSDGTPIEIDRFDPYWAAWWRSIF
jgi:hypothetical protein